MATRTSLIMEPTKTTNHTKMNTNNVPPPPGMMSPIRNSVGVSQSPGGRPSSEQQQQIHSYLSSPLHTNGSTLFVSSPGNNGSVGGSSPGMLRRRAATEDNTQLFLHNNNNSTQQQPQLTQHQRSTSTNGLPWNNIQSNTSIFRSDKSSLASPGAQQVSQEQRNESTHRLRSDLLDPMLLSPTTNTGNSIDDEDEHRLGSPRQQHTPRQQQSNDIFRNNNRGYSPIIGTPTRASGGRKPMYNITSTSHGGAQVGGLRNNLSLSSNSDNDSVTSNGGRWSSNNSQASTGGFATTIRPSLSCPTSVFESPLFPSSNTSSNSIAGSNVHPLTRLGSRGSSLGRSANHLHLSHGGTNTLLLSQPYRLEKITSGSVEPSPINNSDGNANQYEFEDEDDLLVDNVKSQDVFDTESSPIKSPSENSATRHGHRLNLDVSVIEVEDDDSPHRRPIADNNKGPQDRQLNQQQQPKTGGSQHSMASQINNMTASQHANNTAGTKNNTSRPSTAGNESGTTQTTMLDVDGNPMRNLSDAFELLVVDGQQQPLHSQHVYAQQQQQQQRGGANKPHGNQMNDTMLTNNEVTKNNSGETSATKPSPTSVSDFGGETTSSSSLTTNTNSNNNVSTTKKKKHQLANGLTVASISMPHFHLHDTLRGTLNQGLIDRASFYSVLRDINKEALDATLTDPKGHLYNDGSVHEKNKVGNKGGKKNKKQQQGQVGGQSSDANNDTTNTNGEKKKKERPTPIVIAEDGKVHVHPNPKEEQKSILVMACVTDENNETVSEQQLASLREKPVSLGAALLDEEWWLMSAIASRTPNEVAMNQSTNLLPTFFEAMGEKDANSVADSTGVYSTGATSRTQLWKPGRSWWEAKSGKNPWVEPVVHNNRWRYLWPLIHYHKFIAKCIKKLKRNNIDVKTSTSTVSLFLRQEVCNVSDHLAFMSKYDSEEWTSALSHFDGWTDHDPSVEETLRTLVASQRLAGVAETADFQSSLLRSQIDDTILKAMQAAKDEAGRDAYEYKDAPAQQHHDLTALAPGAAPQEGSHAGSSSAVAAHQQQHHYPAQDRSHNGSFGVQSSNGGTTAAWTDESHLRSAIESNKKRTINDTSWSNRAEYHPHHPPYPQQDAYGRQFPQQHYGPPQGYGGHPQGYAGGNGSQYYPQHQYDSGYGGQYSHHGPPPHHMNGGYPYQQQMQYNDQYGHHNQYYNGGGGGHYQASDTSSHGSSFHEGMVFDHSMSHDPYMHQMSHAHTPTRYPGGEMHHGHGQQLGQMSPYWGHLSHLQGFVPSPSGVTPKPPRGQNSSRKWRQNFQSKGAVDGKKPLIYFPNKTNSPASRFVMSPKDNPDWKSPDKTSDPLPNPATLNQSAMIEESFVLPAIENLPESPENSKSNQSLDLMPPSVKIHRQTKEAKAEASLVAVQES